MSFLEFIIEMVACTIAFYGALILAVIIGIGITVVMFLIMVAIMEFPLLMALIFLSFLFIYERLNDK